MKLLETLEGWISVTEDSSGLARMWSSSDATATGGPGVGSTSYCHSDGGRIRSRSSSYARVQRFLSLPSSFRCHFKEGM